MKTEDKNDNIAAIILKMDRKEALETISHMSAACVKAALDAIDKVGVDGVKRPTIYKALMKRRDDLTFPSANQYGV